MKNIYFFLCFQCLNIISVHAQVWSPQKVGIPMNVQMFNISAPDSKTVWVSGYAGTFHTQPWNYTDGNTTLARSTDGGLSWLQSTIDAGEGGAITSLFALDSQIAWATFVNYGVGGKVFKTQDGGMSWKYQPTANFTKSFFGSGFANWVYFWNPNEGVCMGDPVNGIYEIFRTTDGGNNWSRQPSAYLSSALPNEIGYLEMYGVKGDTIWFGTSSGRVFRSINRGQIWKAYSSGLSEISALAFSKREDAGIAFSNYFLDSSYYSKVSFTQNGGETWTSPSKTSFSDQFVFDATFVPETNYILVTTSFNMANGPFNTYLSRDKGLSWIQIENKTPIIRVRFVNPRVGYGGGHKTNVTSPTTLYRYTGLPLTGLLTPSVLDANISLSPNPTADELNIQLTYKEASTFRLNINNVLGDLVYFEDFKDVSTINKSLNIKHLPSGTYIVTISNPTGSLSRKIVKTE